MWTKSGTARLILIVSTNTNCESMAYRSLRSEKCLARGVRKVTTGITGLHKSCACDMVAELCVACPNQIFSKILNCIRIPNPYPRFRIPPHGIPHLPSGMPRPPSGMPHPASPIRHAVQNSTKFWIWKSHTQLRYQVTSATFFIDISKHIGFASKI